MRSYLAGRTHCMKDGTPYVAPYRCFFGTLDRCCLSFS
uniref:Uncharacterized protein n=1 Tax=Anopheles arabiensis TaxID=7173 RepID=A0A182IHF8_ANOAR